MTIKTKILNFLELTRAYTLPASFAPFFVALCWAGYFAPSFKNILLALIAVSSIHLGTNLYDDCIDVVSRLNKGEKLNEINFKDGKNKARLILNGTFSLNCATTIVAILFSIAVLIGIYYFFYYFPIHSLTIFQLAFFGGILCLLYPIATKHYLGEIVIGLLFGFLLPKGVFLILTGYNSLGLSHVSFSLMLLIMALSHVNSIMDWEYDEKNGKKTLARLCKTKSNAIALLACMVFGAFLNLGILVSIYWLPIALALGILTLPIAIELIKSMDDYIHIRNVEFNPKWWMGKMENWQNITNENRAYFMYRFYLARNLILYFAIIIGIAFYLSTTLFF